MRPVQALREPPRPGRQDGYPGHRGPLLARRPPHPPVTRFPGQRQTRLPGSPARRTQARRGGSTRLVHSPPPGSPARAVEAFDGRKAARRGTIPRNYPPALNRGGRTPGALTLVPPHAHRCHESQISDQISQISKEPRTLCLSPAVRSPPTVTRLTSTAPVAAGSTPVPRCAPATTLAPTAPPWKTPTPHRCGQGPPPLRHPGTRGGARGPRPRRQTCLVVHLEQNLAQGSRASTWRQP